MNLQGYNAWGTLIKGLAAVLFAAVTSQVVAADQGKLGALDKDGWHKWSVDAVDNAPAWCCYSWNDNDVQSAACHLDDDINSYGSHERDRAVSVTRMQIFAKVKNGLVERIHALGGTCAVITKGPVANYGEVTTADSLDFLNKQLQGKQRLAGQSLAAIAVHDSDKAQSILESSSHTSRPLKVRKDAVFWMGQVRARQSAGVLERLMLQDETDELREHAVFSVSQSVLENRSSLIEQVALRDESDKVRGQAWFWMAQTDDGEAERRIMAGMELEKSLAVRRQAVFALSQLEGHAGTDALIRIVEADKFDRKVRKQALFWLAQSDSDRAADYLARVLEGGTSYP